jgi:hypothetical protein
MKVMPFPWFVNATGVSAYLSILLNLEIYSSA